MSESVVVGRCERDTRIEERKGRKKRKGKGGKKREE
jgi:hypothetical protein